MRRPVLLVLLTVGPWSGPAAQAQSLATQVSIRWSSPQRILLGEEARVHPGETMRLGLEGSVCSPHTDRTEERGWFIFKKAVRINYDNWVQSGQQPLGLLLLPEAGSAPLQTFRVTQRDQQITVRSGLDGPRTRLQVAAWVPDVDEGRRGASHGEYALTVTIESQPRLAVLSAHLAGARRSPTEILDRDFLCAHVRAQHPREAAGLILRHVQAYYTSKDGEATQQLLRAAMELDGNSPAISGALGAHLLTMKDYTGACPSGKRA